MLYIIEIMRCAHFLSEMDLTNEERYRYVRDCEPLRVSGLNNLHDFIGEGNIKVSHQR